MKNFRVFKTVNSKRIIPGFSAKNLGVILLFLLLFPYLITFLFGNLREGTVGNGMSDNMTEQLTSGQYLVKNKTGMGEEIVPLEIYVADKLARVADDNWEAEALKAQAVLIRTGLFRQMRQNGTQDKYREKSGEEGVKVVGTNMEIQNGKIMIEAEDERYGSVPISDEVYQAVAETAGLCVLFQDEPIMGAYFSVSNGATRSGADLGLEEYPYLKSVLCSRDFLAEDYSSSVSLREKEFWDIWESIPEFNVKSPSQADLAAEMIYTRDDAGYVLYLEYKGKRVAGENFRQAYQLASSCFHISKDQGKVLITVKGKGHGLGMSLYGARQLAAEGKSCVEIIEYFFADVTIAKIE